MQQKGAFSMPGNRK